MKSIMVSLCKFFKYYFAYIHFFRNLAAKVLLYLKPSKCYLLFFYRIWLSLDKFLSNQIAGYCFICIKTSNHGYRFLNL